MPTVQMCVLKMALFISWCDEIKYLGVYIVSGKAFGCSFKHAKESFYRSFNAIFGKIGRIASENVIVELINTKCMSVLLYGVEVCPLRKSHIESLQFAVNGCFMKYLTQTAKKLYMSAWMYSGVLSSVIL